jgi:Ca-activated chloride channel homolog
LLIFKNNFLKAETHVRAVYLIIIFIIGVFTTSSAQVSIPKKQRILFILDASGSMKEKWGVTTKFEAAKKMLLHVVDSVEQKNPNVQFGLRVFGHQYYYTLNNCTDSKLEVPVSAHNTLLFSQRLNAIHPQGNTPIAYSLLQAANDFSSDTNNLNEIILITDGEETCNGNVCDAVQKLSAQHIAVKPFIIGFGLSDSMQQAYQCAGYLINTTSLGTFNSAVTATVTRVLHPTTAQINLLNALGQPTETNVPISLYDHFSGKLLYAFVHTLTVRGLPDTLHLNPTATYDLIVHTIPELRKDDVQLVPGIHNIIALDGGEGNLSIVWDNAGTSSPSVESIVQPETGNNESIIQNAASTQKYLHGSYSVQVFTTPNFIKKDVLVTSGNTTIIHVPAPGTLSCSISTSGMMSVLMESGSDAQKVVDWYHADAGKAISLLPGKYIVLFRPDKVQHALDTKSMEIVISSNHTTGVKF